MKKALLFLGISFGLVSAIFAQKEYYLAPYTDYSGFNYCLTWEANSGKSIMYYWDSNISNWVAAEVNLPSSPIAGATGKIMMEAYLDNNGTTYYQTWDISTGKSQLYYWNTSQSNWLPVDINLPAKPVPSAAGNIMLDPYSDYNGNAYCMAWAENTGKSQSYFWSIDDSDWVALEIGVPEKPILGSTGKIMFKNYMDQYGNAYSLAWEVSTGKSQLYYWNSESSSWDALPINLPEKPIPGATGNIMLEPYRDGNGTDYCLAWAETGGKSILYYWNSDNSVWDAAAINLPEKPVPGATGKIMIKPYFDENAIGYCLAWDKSTGQSQLYYWNADASSWDALPINLPANPTGK
jgi:hypothetical protein